MRYRVVFSDRARRQLKKLDRQIAADITGWIRENLENCADPRAHGKGLTANRSGQWRYRVGDYRVIAHISDETVTILILDTGHRKEIYR